MPLVPNRWTEDVISAFDAPDDLCEGTSSLKVRLGFYDAPGQETFLVDEERTWLNHAGRVLRRETIAWEYEIAGAPPTRYTRELYADVYLPKVSGRGTPKLVEREITTYYPWTNWDRKGGLSSIKKLSGYVLYDRKPTDAARTADEEASLADKGHSTTGSGRLIVSSARLWREALHEGRIVESADTPQEARWIEPVETEAEVVVDQANAYLVYHWRQNHIRGGDVEIDGPDQREKPSYTYRLPVAIEPPEVSAGSSGDDGLRIEITGGGATVNSIRVHPERYRLERRTISEPAATQADDPYALWDTDPATPPSAARIWTDTAVTNIAGTPQTTSQPAQTSYTEPGDTAEEDDDGWVVVAEPDNAAPDGDEGYATVTDGEVVPSGVYEYRAVAVIGQDESPPSTPDRATYSGADRSSSIRVRVREVTAGDREGETEVDVLAPDPATALDPDALGDWSEEYGEVVEIEVPTDLEGDDLVDLAEEIGTRWFEETRTAKTAVEIVLARPVLGLDRGMLLATPATEWTTTGNGLRITSELAAHDWVVDGWSITFRRGDSGDLEPVRTVVKALEP